MNIRIDFQNLKVNFFININNIFLIKIMEITIYGNAKNYS